MRLPMAMAFGHLVGHFHSLPRPAATVSTVKLTGEPTMGPTGSMPGPYAIILQKREEMFS